MYNINMTNFLVFQMPEAVSKFKEDSQLSTFQNCENISYLCYIISRYYYFTTNE